MLYVPNSGSYPILSSVAVGNDVTSGSITQYTFNMPSGVQSGDLLFAGLATDTSITATLTGWTKLGPSSTGCQVWMKIADGTEGATEVATWSGAQPCGRGYAARFTSWDGSSYDSSTTSSFSGTVNPPNLAPGWGAVKIKWVVFGFAGLGTITAISSGFTDSYIAGTSTDGVDTCIGFGTLDSTVSSLNPGAFTGGTDGYRAYTIAIKPA